MSHHNAGTSRQAGCWLAAGVHKSPTSVRDRQVDACSQPLPKPLYRRGANIAARDDSLLLLFSLSLTQSHVAGKGGSSG